MLKVKGRWKVFHESGKQKRAGVAIPISDKIDFKPKMVIWGKEGHYIMINVSVHWDDTRIENINIYIPTHQWSTWIFWAIPNRSERLNRQQHDNGHGLHYSTFTMCRLSTQNQQKEKGNGLEPYCRPSGNLTRPIYNIPSLSRRTHSSQVQMEHLLGWIIRYLMKHL